MNNKLIGYDEAVGMIQDLEKQQKVNKRRRRSLGQIRRSNSQSLVELTKKEINILLSLIHAHKQARKLHKEARHYKDIALSGWEADD